MNIILVTELFWGMEESLEQTLGVGTTAIYDLVKNWTRDNKVVCIREIPIGWKRWLINKMKAIFGYENVYDKIADSYEVDGIKVYTMKYLSYPHNQIIGKIFYRRFAKRINGLLEEANWKPDIVISHMPTFNVMYYIGQVFMNVPKLAILHRSDLDKLYKREKIVKYRVNLLEINFDKIFSRSTAIYNKAKATGLSNLTEDLVVSSVPMNINNKRKWLNLCERKINILYAGLLIEQKGVQQILHSIASLKDKYMLRLTIVGSGSYEKNLQMLTKTLKIEEYVDFAGQKRRQEVYDYMRNSDLFIMPSYHETFGLVYLEAMSSGCITIGSKGEGIDGVIINGENGYLVNPYDVNEITKCLQTIICMPDNELNRISDAAVKTAQMYSEENVSEQYLKLIEKMLCNHYGNSSYGDKV